MRVKAGLRVWSRKEPRMQVTPFLFLMGRDRGAGSFWGATRFLWCPPGPRPNASDPKTVLLAKQTRQEGLLEAGWSLGWSLEDEDELMERKTNWAGMQLQSAHGR